MDSKFFLYSKTIIVAMLGTAATWSAYFAGTVTLEVAVTATLSAAVMAAMRMITTDPDWNGTLVGVELSETKSGTQVRFHHSGWPEANEHYRISVHCWALYLRILRRYLEFGETVPYEKRLSV